MIGYGPVTATAEVSVYARHVRDLLDLDESGRYGSPVACVVRVDGPLEATLHLPAAYLDEMLNRERRRDAEERAYRVSRRLESARLALDDNPDGAIGPVDLFAYIDNASPYAQVETKLYAALRTRTTCRPRHHFPRVIEAAFWGLWNTMVLTELDGQLGAAEPMLDNILFQFDFYDVRGFSARRIGEAVRHAGFKGAGQRAVEEQAAAANMTPEEFRSLPEAERDAILHDQVVERLRRHRLETEGTEPPQE